MINQNCTLPTIISFMHPIRHLHSLTCACCYENIKNSNQSAYWFPHRLEEDVDVRNLPAELPVGEGAPYVPAVGEADDEDGYEWRCFCKDCWNEYKWKSNADLYLTFDSSDYE